MALMNKRVSVVVPEDCAEGFERLKQESFSNLSQAELLRLLLKWGLRKASKDISAKHCDRDYA